MLIDDVRWNWKVIRFWNWKVPSYYVFLNWEATSYHGFTRERTVSAVSRVAQNDYSFSLHFWFFNSYKSADFFVMPSQEM